MKNRLFFYCVLITTHLQLNSQELRRPMTAIYAGTGAYSMTHTDVFSQTTNQASLAQLRNTQAGIYGERRFLLSELNNYIAVMGLHTKSGNFGLKAMYYGFSNYNETQLGLAYGRKLTDKIDLGAQFNYNGIKVAGYGKTAAVSFEVGTIFHFTDKVHAGVHVNNPVGGKFAYGKQEKLPSIYTAGIGYEASDKLLVSMEIIKEEDQPVNVNAGIQYKFLPQMMARLGMATATSTAWMGVGFSWSRLRFDVISAYHPHLGITPGLLLIFNFKTKED